jgi:hypothetical protein
MKYAILEGFRRMARAPGLVLLLYGSNLFLASLLALPLTVDLTAALESRPGASLESGPFWADWRAGQQGWAGELTPEILGSGTFFLSTERLLGGQIPGGLLAPLAALPSRPLDGVILGLGVASVLLHAFFLGGLIGTYRALRGTWSPNGFFHGSAFYFGRMVRAGLVGLVFGALVFALHAPLGRALWSASLGVRSETQALLLTLLSHVLLLAAILFVSMVTAYARVIIVAEERRSATLAWLSALVFCCGRSFPKAFGHSVVMALLTTLLALGWARVDAVVDRSLIGLFLVSQLVVATRVAFGLATLAGRYALFTKAAGRG